MVGDEEKEVVVVTILAPMDPFDFDRYSGACDVVFVVVVPVGTEEVVVGDNKGNGSCANTFLLFSTSFFMLFTMSYTLSSTPLRLPTKTKISNKSAIFFPSVKIPAPDVNFCSQIAIFSSEISEVLKIETCLLNTEERRVS